MSVRDGRISLNWIAPFTLDISNDENDIDGYCIEVMISTSSRSLCGITVMEYSFPLPMDSVCHVYRVVVAAVNGVGRGENNTLTYSQVETSTSVNISFISLGHSLGSMVR